MAADADPKAAATAPAEAARQPSGPRKFPLPQLRLHDRQVYVGFGPTPLSESLSIADLALIVPDVSFPFDIAGGAATRYQRKKCRFGYLDLEVGHDLFARAAARVQQACAEHVAGLRLHLSPGLFEGEGLLHAPQGPSPFTFRVGFQPEGSGVLACVFDVRLYGPAPVPAPFAAALIARGALTSAAVPDAKPFGAVGVAFDPVEQLVRRAVPLRGFRVPDFSGARLGKVEPGPRSFHLHFESGARAEVSLDAELLSCVEGTRAFAEGEEMLARGDLAAAEAFYLRRGEGNDSHPFARERLLGLLAARADAQDLALDLAMALRQARPGTAAPLWAEAGLRLARGESKAAGELYLKLGSLARARNEEASAFHAFAAAGRALLAPAPGLASRAFQDALAIRPDDLDCLQALAVSSDRAGEPEGALRAYRRIAALARDPAQATRAHVRLGEILGRLTKDRAAARLHFDAALRRLPSDPDALLGLERLCRADGEHLRALKLLDELRAEAQRRGDRDLEALSCLEAGATWDAGLSHPSNALLRYQEAERLAPERFEASLELGQLFERLGRPAEAVEGYQRAAVAAEGWLSRGKNAESARASAHRAHHALARICTDRLGDQPAARRHFEAALELDPEDPVALRALLPAWRTEGQWDLLAKACERCAASAADPAERAALLCEAGELFLGPLGLPARAEAVLEQALLVDPVHVRALQAMAKLAEAQLDGPRLCRSLLKLAELQSEPRAKAALLRRLARGARDVVSDLDLAADALTRALVLEPEVLADRAALVEVHRRRADLAALASALASLARGLEKDGQFVAAAAALRELAALYDERLGRGAEAMPLLEKAAALAPEDRGLVEGLAELSLKHGRPAVAREAYRSLLASLPRDARAEEVARMQAGLGRACQALGERDSALEALAQAFATRPEDDDLGSRLDALLSDSGRAADRAAARLARGRAKLSVGLAGAAAAQFAGAAKLYEELGEAVAALSAWAATLDADPDGPAAAMALDALAQAAIADRDPARACELIARRAAFDLEGRCAARRLYRAAALIKEGDAARFRSLLAAALERDSDYPPVRATLAWLRLKEKDASAALAHARVALGNPRDPDALELDERTALQRVAARAAAELGDLEGAQALLTAYSENAPRDEAALVELASLQRKTGSDTDLARTLERLASRQQGSPAVATLRELAGLLWAVPERRADALDAWRDALKLSPADRTCLEGLAAALDRPAEAPERVRTLHRLLSLAESPDERVRLLARCGESLSELGRFAEAASAWAEAAAASRRPSGLLDKLVEAARKAGDKALEADALARRAVLAAEAGEADAAERLLVAGRRLGEAGRRAEARRLVARACELASPESSLADDALESLADLHAADGERREAAAVLVRLADRHEGSERCAALLRAVSLARAEGDAQLARGLLDLALKAAPADRLALQTLRAVCLETRDDRGLVSALERLLALPLPDRRDAAVQSSELADALTRLEEPERAEAALRKAFSHDRTLPGVEERLFALLVSRGALDEALPLGERLARALADGPAARRLVDLSARAEAHLDDRGLALRYARLALLRAPGDLGVARRLSRLLYAAGSVSEALPLLERAAAKVDFEADPEEARDQRLAWAELLFEVGDLRRASSVLEGLLTREPSDAAVAERLFEVLLPTEPERAVATLSRHARSLAKGSRPRTLFLRLAEVARTRLAAPRAAAEFLEQAQSIEGEELDLDLARVDLLREAGDRPALGRALGDMADRAVKQGELDRALVALDELAMLEADDDARAAVETLSRASRLCEAAGRLQDAARRLAARGGLLQQTLSDPSGAESAFRRAFQLDPSSLGWGRAAAALCRQRGDASGEAELLEAMVPRLEGPERCDALVRLAQVRQEQGASSLASSYLEEALRIDPQLEVAREIYEQILGVEGRLAELARSVQARAVVEVDPAQRAAHFRKAAELFGDVGDLDACAKAWRAACEATPADLGLAEACAEALVALGRFDEARPYDARVLAADPTRRGSFDRQAGWLKDSGDHGALALLLEARAAREAPTQAAGLLVDAAVLRERLGDHSGAEQAESRAFALDPVAERPFSAALARAGTRVDAVCELLLRRARAVPPQAAALHRQRGELLFDAGRNEEAVSALDDALFANAKDAVALELRASVAEAMGGDEAAEPYDARLTDIASHGGRAAKAALARAHYRLGFVALGRGERKAKEHLEAGYALDPMHPRSARALEILADEYGRSGDRAMLFRVRMAQASRSEGTGSRAAALAAAADAAPDAASEVAALSSLVELRAGDAALAERLAESLFKAGRVPASAEAYRHAAEEAVEGTERARLLVRAADLFEGASEADRAAALRLEAWRSHPCLQTARSVLSQLRVGDDATGLDQALAAIAAGSPDADEAAGARLERARLLERTGQDAAAADAFLEVARRDAGRPGFVEATERGHELLLKLGRYGQAAEVHAAGARQEAEPRHRALQLVEAARILDELADEPQQAEGLLSEAAAAGPDLPEPWAALSSLFRRRSDWAGQAKALEEEARRTRDGLERSDRLTQAGRAWAAAGKPEQAFDAFDRAIAAAPESVRAHLACAEVAEAQAQTDRALEHLLAAAALEPGEPKRAHLSRAAALALGTGRVAEAFRVQRVLFELDPTDEPSFQALRAAPGWGDPKVRAELIDLRERALEALPAERAEAAKAERVSLLCERGLLLAGPLGTLIDAERAWRKGLDLDPRCREALSGLRELAFARKDTVRYLELLEAEAGASQDGAEKVALFEKLAAAAREAQPERAAGALEQAIGVAGSAGLETLGLKRTLAELLLATQPDRAAALAEALLAAGAGDVKLRVLLAEARLALGDRPAARREFQRALEVPGADESLLSRFEELSADSPADKAWAYALRADRAPEGPAQVALLLAAASGWREAGRVDEERVALSKVLAADPTSEAAFERLDALLESSPQERCALLVGRAQAKPAEAAKLLEKVGALRLALGDAAGAVQALEDSLSRQDSAEAVRALAQARLAAGQVEAADLEGRAGTLSVPQVCAVALEVGRACEAQGQRPQALAHFDLAARLSPTPHEALREIIRAAGEAGAVEQGLAACERLLALDPRGADAPQVHLKASEWCEALGRAPDAAKHLEVAVLQGAGGSAALEKLSKHYDATGTWPEAAATLTWFAEVTDSPPARAAAWRRASKIYADECHDPAQAISVAERALAGEPGAVDLLEWLCDLEIRRGEPARVVAACERLSQAAGAGALVPRRRAYASALGQSGRAAEALSLLQQVLSEGFDEAVATQARDLAQASGDAQTWLRLELELVERLGADRASDAASRLRELASRVEEEDPGRAADLVARAAALVPASADAEREASLRERAGDLAGAARPLCTAARARPLDEALLGRLAAGFRASGDLARASALESIRSFSDPSKRFAAAHTGARVQDGLRSRLHDAEAVGPVARLLRALAPALGAAFPSDLGRFGVGESDQVGPMHAPALAARVREAREAVGLPSLEVFLAPSLGNEVALEPGAPDRLVVGLPCLTELDPGALSFLLVRACELSHAGFALAAQAGGDGLEGLVRCALAASGASVPVPEPFDAMVEVTAEAVRELAPAGLDALVVGAMGALPSLAPFALLEAQERTASRVALLVCGEPGAALRALVGGAMAASEGLAAAGLRAPLVEDLVRTCLRDDWGALRAACLAGSEP
ncbi:MAG TPA: hypothetical protein VGK67_29670 [Myxococcales bacterium]|jgi:tetratricopeptide (TPR) repeat protein